MVQGYVWVAEAAASDALKDLLNDGIDQHGVHGGHYCSCQFDLGILGSERGSLKGNSNRKK